MKKWNRSLGTSKREQGVETPPAPQHPKRRREFFERMELRTWSWYKKLWDRLRKIWGI